MYFGDTQNMPYGEKTKEQLISFSYNIFKFFEQKGAKAVVMACNTTSATTYDTLKDKFNFKIYPIIQSVTTILSELPIKKLGILATHATINSHAYKNGINKLNPNIEVIEQACPEWVKIVESRQEDLPESKREIKEDLENILKYKPDKIVLGCTHYPYLLNNLKKYAPENMFINPAAAFAQYIKSDLENCGLLSTTGSGQEEYYVSGSPENFEKAASIFYDLKTSPKQIILNENRFHNLQLQ